ncbi:formate dehydrogenase subunit alpha [Halomarina salina]|uniref:Formate dehydrogenase subunit alpha n=1 Tax=Halomarina salina TaxID=1872699 RepID=A0ABD5RNW1_9EURY|nr:formate dehydrogenase subunit alpha [Halomarina salina]
MTDDGSGRRSESESSDDQGEYKKGVAGFMQRAKEQAKERASSRSESVVPTSKGAEAGKGPGLDTSAVRNEALKRVEHVVSGTAAKAFTEGRLFDMADAISDYRLEQVDVTDTTCTYCAVGCRFDLYTKDGKVLGTRPTDPEKAPINGISTCVKGKFGWDFVDSDDRLTEPLVKEDGEFREATWDEALDRVADGLRDIEDDHGADALGFVSSSKAGNEDNYAMQKFVRQSFGTHNVDNCNRLCHSPTVSALSSMVGYGAASVDHDDLENTDCYLITGSNTTENHPVLATRIKQNVLDGADIYVFDPREVRMAEFEESHYTRVEPGQDTVWINGMVRHVIEEDLHDEAFIEERTTGFEEVKESVQKFTPEYVEEVTGAPPEELKEAAEAVAKADSCCFCWTLGLTEHAHGTENVVAMANLALVTGHVGKEHSGLSPFRGQNNVQGGGGDMGPIPPNFPGYQSVTDDENREKFEEAYGVDLPDEPGLTITEQFLAADDGDIKGMYVMGENPALSEPNVAHAEEILANLDFLAVQDIFMTETAEHADVVLPATTAAESNGTFTASTRRVQLVKQAIDPKGNSKQDWQIVQELSKRFGNDWGYETAADIMDEVADLTPIYGGISHDRLEEEGGLCWPCYDEDHPGTGTMYLDEFETDDGLAHMRAPDVRGPSREVDEEFPLALTTGRVLYQYHTGTMTHRQEGIMAISGENFIEIHPETAEELGVADDEYVVVTSPHGSIRVIAQVTERPGPGTVFIPMHFEESAVNLLTDEEALDPDAHAPEYKHTPVSVRPADDQSDLAGGVAAAEDIEDLPPTPGASESPERPGTGHEDVESDD